MIPPVPWQNRFWLHVRKTKSCWLWTRAKRPGGYGVLGAGKGGTMRAHRAAWELTKGSIPPKLCILHRCDNPPCVRPSPLFLGTRGDNAKDRDEKGRRKTGRVYPGIECKTSKLTNQKVKAIRRMRENGWTMTAIGRKMGIHHTHVRRIVLRISWRHL